MANLTHTWTDDDGSGTVGTIINNSQLQTVYQNTGHADAHTVGGRLTLTSGLPVTVNDVTGATTIYYTPYLSDVIALFDGSATWIPLSFSETSIALGTLTNTLPYDVFAFNNGGSLGLELLAWSSTTARATALVYQNGVLVKSGVTTRRYLGTFCTTSSTTTEDSALKRDVFNYYNRVRRPFVRVETTSSWSGTNNSTPRQLNGSGANQIEVTVGVAETPVWLATNLMTTSTAAGVPAAVGIGFDSTSTFLTAASGGGVSAVSSQFVPMAGSGYHQPTIGRHVYAVLEESQTGQSTTFYGSSNGSFFGNTYQPGVTGWIEG